MIAPDIVRPDFLNLNRFNLNKIYIRDAKKLQMGHCGSRHLALAYYFA
jgi:hypothetical protein